MLKLTKTDSTALPTETEPDASFGAVLRLRDLRTGPLFLLRPRSFFSRMAKEGGYRAPALYALAWLFVSVVAEVAVSYLRPVRLPVSPAVQIGWIVVGPFLLLLIGFILAGILYGIWRLMGSEETYQTAFRCWAFLAPVSVIGSVLSVAPYLNLTSYFLSLALLAVASIEVHRIPPRRAWTVWGLIAAVSAAWVVSVMLRPPVSPPLPRLSENAPATEEMRDAAEELSDELGPDTP
jgi:hypothetical protein